ncbi:hypothetical protein BDP27DRAFT_1352168 [Rhodocollybia butyracea]|uniref:Uncharacterized protein n=1 Tax=Rhodocollybia butyracea TaxID=206335 RepID=A0A9P5P3J8_9AGAR|nr:hypothetical protein BDP27DRAFT_1352168 [Rhodocollybia butyracea]
MHSKVVCLYLLAVLMFTSIECAYIPRTFTTSLLTYQGEPRPRRPERNKGSRPHDPITSLVKSQVTKALREMCIEHQAKVDQDESLQKLFGAGLRWDTTYVDRPELVTYFEIRGLVCDPYCLGFIVRSGPTETHGELHYIDKQGEFRMLSLRKGREYERSPAKPAEIGEFLTFLENKTKNLPKSLEAPIKAPIEVIARPNKIDFTYKTLQAAVRLEKDSDSFERFRTYVANAAGVVGINYDLPYMEQPNFHTDEICRQVAIADVLSYFNDIRFPNFWATREALKMYLEDYQAKHGHKPASGPRPKRSKPRRGGHKKNRRFSGPQPVMERNEGFEDPSGDV